MSLKGLLATCLFISTMAFAGAEHIKREPFPGGMLITEWDLAFPDQETLENYQATANTKLIVNNRAPKTFDIWSPRDRMNLTYCVSNEFGPRKKDIVEALRVATEDWMDIARIKFIYRAEQDSKCNFSNNNVMFDVRPANAGMYLARAFFPGFPRSKRNLMVDNSVYKYSFVAITGFLRHELGHALGFRHEHISAQGNGQCREDTNYTPVTSYDQLSVMHYPQCGGKNSIQDMILSELDKQGASKVYP